MLKGSPAGRVLPWAILLAGVGAAAAIILRLFTDPATAVLAIVIMLVLMATAVLFLTLASMGGPPMQILALIFAYSSVLLVIISATLLMTSFFFRWPRVLAPPIAPLSMGLPRDKESGPILAAIEELKREPHAVLGDAPIPQHTIVDKTAYDVARAGLCGASGARFDIVMLDDPWIPAEAKNLIPLNDIAEFKQDEATLRSEFHANLLEVCTRDGKLIGLPAMGNVLVFLYRRDALPEMETILEPSDAGLRVIRAERMGRLESALQRARLHGNFGGFRIGDATNSDLSEAFLELYRVFGNREDVDQAGNVILEEGAVRSAWQWMHSLDPMLTSGRPRMRKPQIVSTLMTDGRPAAMFAYSQYFIPEFKDRAERLRLVDFEQFVKHPILGFWILAIRKECPAEKRSHAYLMIRELTRTRSLQIASSDAGGVPVTTWCHDVASNQFWYHVPDSNDPNLTNRDRIVSCLARSRPRPRTELWNTIEDELGALILSDDFEEGAKRLKHVTLAK